MLMSDIEALPRVRQDDKPGMLFLLELIARLPAVAVTKCGAEVVILSVDDIKEPLFIIDALGQWNASQSAS